MKVIYDPNIEGTDFIEIILTPQEYEELQLDPIVREGRGMWKRTPTNISVRVNYQLVEEED